MNMKLILIYLAILVFTGFFGLISEESLRIVGFINKNNISAILILASFIIFVFDKRALSVVQRKVDNNEYKYLFIYMWLFVFISILSYVLTVAEGYDAVYSIKVAFNFIQYILLLVLYLLLLSLSETKFSWLMKTLEKMVFLNMVIYVLNNFGISLLAAEDYMELDYGLVRNFKGFPQLLPFFFSLVYMRFRNKVTTWNSLFIFFTFLTLVFSFTRSWIVVFIIVTILLEVFVIRKMNISSIIKIVSVLLSISISLVYFFPHEMNLLAERFNPAISAASIYDIENVNIRWLIFEERLNLLYEHPFFGVGFINTYDPNNYYRFITGESVLNGDNANFLLDLTSLLLFHKKLNKRKKDSFPKGQV